MESRAPLMIMKAVGIIRSTRGSRSRRVATFSHRACLTLASIFRRQTPCGSMEVSLEKKVEFFLLIFFPPGYDAYEIFGDLLVYNVKASEWRIVKNATRGPVRLKSIVPSFFDLFFSGTSFWAYRSTVAESSLALRWPNLY